MVDHRSVGTTQTALSGNERVENVRSALSSPQPLNCLRGRWEQTARAVSAELCLSFSTKVALKALPSASWTPPRPPAPPKRGISFELRVTRVKTYQILHAVLAQPVELDFPLVYIFPKRRVPSGSYYIPNFPMINKFKEGREIPTAISGEPVAPM